MTSTVDCRYAARLQLSGATSELEAACAAARFRIYRVWPDGEVTIENFRAVTRHDAQARLMAALDVGFEHFVVDPMPYGGSAVPAPASSEGSEEAPARRPGLFVVLGHVGVDPHDEIRFEQRACGQCLDDVAALFFARRVPRRAVAVDEDEHRHAARLLPSGNG